MKQLKVVVGILIISSCFIIMLMYYWHRSSLTKQNYSSTRFKTTTVPTRIVGTPMQHVPLDVLYADMNKIKGDDSFELDDYRQALAINTPGCEIPVAMVNYKNNGKAKEQSGSCNKRAVFLRKSKSNEVHAEIKTKAMRKYLRRSASFHCCYRFLRRSNRVGYEDLKIQYTKCRKFEHDSKIKLEHDFVNVRCFEFDRQNTSHAIYDDVYGFTNKINISKAKKTNCKTKYNVLLLGMDSMSLSRFVQTMSETSKVFQDNFWLVFRGYHKVGDNTFPNLMAAFTGKKLSTITKLCSKGMDRCNDHIIWSTFKKAGYVTAYGEDYLRLPDTFSNRKGFRTPPTDHYMRPLFLKGETEMNNKSLVCSGKVSSGRQLLDFALDFANTYRDDSFFGVFWMNSYSHNINSRPQDADKIFENFFNQLSYTGVQERTFIIFFSDHGVRFGENRLKIESYYDERMPALFMFAPVLFGSRYPIKSRSLIINQFRLITPYDLYNTFQDIHHLSTCSNTSDISEGCPNCQSLFSVVSANRTCQDVAIHDKWCSCHKLYPLDVQDTEGIKSVMLAVSHIKSMLKTAETRRCWACMNLSLNKIIRIHFYYKEDKSTLYHVVAFVMTPGNVSYEAVVMKSGHKVELVGPVSVISPYRGLGKCTVKPKDRLFCVCQKNQNCR